MLPLLSRSRHSLIIPLGVKTLPYFSSKTHLRPESVKSGEAEAGGKRRYEMMKTGTIIFFVWTLGCLFPVTSSTVQGQPLRAKTGVQSQLPRRIIDMHLHSYTQQYFTTAVKDYYGNGGSANAGGHFDETYAAMRKFHVMHAVVSGSVMSVDEWVKKDVDHRIIRGIAMDEPGDHGMDSVQFERLVKAGKIEVFGEIGTYYSGSTLNDSAWQPYLRICERYDIPVAVHTGGGDPGGTYTWSPKARLKYGDPYLLEDVLVRYPRLRLYMMHSGEDWYEHALRLMAYYPQLCSDLGAMLWVEPMDQRYATAFLRNAKQAGYLDRVMYGTDQMRWPEAMEKSIRFLNGLDFLTREEKDGIFWRNAERFLRLAKSSLDGKEVLGSGKAQMPDPTASDMIPGSTEKAVAPFVRKGGAGTSALQSELAGSWRMVADQLVDSTGRVINQDTAVSGLLIYTTEGRMSVQLQWHGRRSPIMTDTVMNSDGVSDGLGIGSNVWSVSVARSIIDTYDAYFGRYTVDVATQTVTHCIDGNLRPEKAGTVYERRFRIAGDRLFMRSTNPAVRWQVEWKRG